MAEDDIMLAHQHSIRHRDELQASQSCGCFFCAEVFGPADISEWTDEGQTAICPHCGVDAVIGDASGFPLTEDFLARMNQHWF